MQNLRSSREPKHEIPAEAKFLLIAAAIVITIAALGFFTFAGSKKVDAGEACALTSYGKLSGKDVGPGWNWNQPFGTDYVCLSTRIQTQEYTDGDTKANHKDSPITDAVSADGVNNTIYAMFQFQVPRENIDDLYRSQGRSMDQVVDKLQIVVRDQVRNVVKSRTEDQVYLQTPQTTQAIVDTLRPLIEARGITFVSFNISVVIPDQSYTDAVRNRQLEAENTKQKVAEGETAKIDAENKKIAAQGDADAAVINAQGQADANQIVAASLKDNPELLTMEYYRMLGTSTWMVWSPEDLQPTMPIETPTPTPAP